MSKLIIIRGPLGIGKSTISKLVAKKINGKYYSIDDILNEKNLDIIDKNLGCIPENNFIKANKLIIQTLKNNLKQNIPVIVDGNFYWESALKHLIDELKEYESFVFTLKADLNTCIQRDKQRKNPHGEEAAKAVYQLVSKFDCGFIIENRDSNIEEKINKIIYLILH